MTVSKMGGRSLYAQRQQVDTKIPKVERKSYSNSQKPSKGIHRREQRQSKQELKPHPLVTSQSRTPSRTRRTIFGKTKTTPPGRSGSFERTDQTMVGSKNSKTKRIPLVCGPHRSKTEELDSKKILPQPETPQQTSQENECIHGKSRQQPQETSRNCYILNL